MENRTTQTILKPIAKDCKFFGFGSTFFLDSPVVKELVEWLKQEYPNIPRVLVVKMIVCVVWTWIGMSMVMVKMPC